MKAKPVLLVVLTLIIGFVIGMLTSAQLRIHKLKPVRQYFSVDRFREGFFNTIQPDAKQKAEIEKILDKYANYNTELQENFRTEFDSSMKAMRKELDSKLTKEQIAKLKAMDERRQEMIREYWRSHGDTTHFRDMRRRGPGPGGRQFHGNGPMPPPGRRPFEHRDTSRLPDGK